MADCFNLIKGNKALEEHFKEVKKLPKDQQRAAALALVKDYNKVLHNDLEKFKKRLNNKYKIKKFVPTDNASQIEVTKAKYDKLISSLKESVVPKSDKTVKAVVREKTGQTDTSPKVVTTEAKVLKERFTNLEKGIKLGERSVTKTKAEFIDEVKKAIRYLGNNISNPQIRGLLNAVKKINTKNIDDVRLLVDKLIDQVEKKAKDKKYGPVLRKLVKKAKRNAVTKFGRFGKNIKKLAFIPTDWISDENIEEYFEVMQSLSLAKDVDFKRVDALYEKMKENILAYAEMKYQEKLEAVKEKSEDLKGQVLLQGYVSDLSKADRGNFSYYENNVIDEFLKIPLEYLFSLDKAKISSINKSLSAITNGYMLNKTLDVTILKYKALQVAKEIKESVGDTLLKPVLSLRDYFNTKFRNDLTSEDFEKRIYDVMLQHVDSTVRGLKGTSLYEHIIHPLTSAFNKSEIDTNHISSKLTSLIKKAKSKRFGNRLARLPKSILRSLNIIEGENYEFNFNTILQLYFRQLEFDSNPLEQGKKVFSMKSHMAATLDKRGGTGMSDDTLDIIEKLYNTFSDSDGEVDTNKIWDYLTKEEKAVVEYIKEELQIMESKSREINDHVRGETLTYFNNYFPRKNSVTGSNVSDLPSLSEKINAMLGSTSVKQTASNERVDGARPLDFNTFATFMSAIKESNLEYDLSIPIKNSGIILTELSSSENNSLVKLSKALERSVKTLIESQLNVNVYTPKKKRDIIFRTLVRRTFTRMLIDPIRLMFDFGANYTTFFLAYADKIPAIIKSGRSIDKGFVKILNTEFSSTQAERLGGSRSVDFKESQVSTLGKQKYKENTPTIVENLTDLYSKNVLSDFSDKASDMYYRDIVDKPAIFIWKLKLSEAFNKISGKPLDTKKFKESKEYRDENSENIKKAILQADKAATTLFNTAARSEQKLNVQATSSNFMTRFNSFMRSFTFNENRVFWDSLKSIVGKGTMDRSDAIRAFGIVNARSIIYSYASQVIVSALLRGLGYNDEDKNWYDLDEKAFHRALAQHGALVLLGNKTASFNIAAALLFERIRQEYMDAEFKKGNRDKKYNPYDDSLLYTMPKRGALQDYVGALGAEGYALRALYEGADLASKITAKIYLGEEITEEEIVQWKSYRITVSLLSQVTGLPIERSGKLQQKIEEYKLKKKNPEGVIKL